ncbi:hypothetical protein MMC31_007979, partial [Peltigera leucophlebia]|nr:hypothetical protein [Peltigera leucophlebia]
IQRLVHKNETGLSSKLAAQEILQEAIDGALTGCRVTLAAFGLELDKLIEPKKGTKTTELGCQAKARLVWKEDIRKQLLYQTRGQMSSLHCLAELLESVTQTEILSLLKEKSADTQKVLHRTRSTRSEQGINDYRSSFNVCAPIYRLWTGHVVRGAVVSVPRYTSGQRTATAEELLARKD